MAVDGEQAGWWMASDGKWYPPELHPDFEPPRLSPDSVFKALPYGGTCITCGTTIPRRARGWHDPSISKVACANCPPQPQALPQDLNSTPHLRTNPAGGTSALAIANSRRDPHWTKGAAGEYLMSKSLHERLPPDRIILDDRTVPHSHANIDHVVISPTGVWIIDSKHWKGLIQVKTTGGFLSATQKLFVDGRDESALTEKIYSQVIPIANVLGDRSIPIHPALIFIDGDWGAGITLRVLQHRPYEMLGVMVGWPKAVIAKISESGPLPQEEVVRIATLLDRSLPPAS